MLSSIIERFLQMSFSQNFGEKSQANGLPHSSPESANELRILIESYIPHEILQICVEIQNFIA